MKKKFIFLAMMLLTFLGVNLNVLNAQETITIGNGEDPNYDTPYDMYEGYGVAQQLFEYSEINKSGIITSLSFRFYGETPNPYLTDPNSGRTYSRSMAIYLTEYDGEGGSLLAGVDLEATLEPNFDGTVTFEAGEWVSFDFTNDFEYHADKNLLLTIVDKSSDGLGSNYYWWYCDVIEEGHSVRRNAEQVTNIAGINSEGLNVKTYRNQIQLTFEASGPKPLALTLEGDTEIYLNESTTIRAIASDGSGEYTSYSWTMNEEPIEFTGTEYTFTPSATGEYTFTCTVTDSEDATATASTTVTVTERPALVLSVSADDIEIYSDETTTLYANAQYGSGIYTYSWSLNGETVGTDASYTFAPSTTGEYTFTCTVTDSEENEAYGNVTVNVTERPESPFAGKQFRVRVGYSQNHTGKYLNVSSYTMSTTNLSNVATSTIADNSMQIFTVEEADNGYYYLRTIDGNYIECGANNTYNVDCYQQSPNSPLQFDYTNSTYFYMRDTKKSGNNYFKVNSDGRVYCDADIDAAAIWVLDEVIPEAPDAPTLSANAISATAVQLSWNAVSGADTYTVYEGTTVIAENITGTNYTHEGLTASTTYNYTVTATNEIGTSEVSNTATATTWAPAPEAAPANLQATSVTHNSVTLTWDAVDDATYYEIYKDGSYLSYTNTTTYTATGLSAETSYSFTVKAGNNSGTSLESEALSVTTEKFIGCTVVFKLYDSYGDGWNTANMTITYGGKTEILEFLSGAETTYEREFLSGSEVNLCYNKNSNSWVYENKFTIMYEDGEVIWERAGSDYGGDLSNTDCYDFTVKSILPSPENLAIVEGEKTQLYPGETTEISWDPLDGAAGYNVYVKGAKFNTEVVEGLSYELVNLPYGMNTIAVAAVFADDSESGMSNTVTVQMAGTFPLTIKVQDMKGNAVANASLTIEGFDEYQVYKTFEGTTDVNGEWYKADMPLLYEYFPYNIMVSAEPFEDRNSVFYESETANGVAFTQTIEMELPTIEARTEKESYEANEDIVLFWNAVDSEYLQGYKVYVNDEENPRNTELLTSAIYTLEGGLAETGYISVTAVYEGYGESAKGYGTYVNINAYGTISGTVTDGINPIVGAEVVVEGRDKNWKEQRYTTLTNAEGAFELEVLPSYEYDDNVCYSVSVSKYGYSSYKSTEKYKAVVGSDIILDAIVLTANADVTFAVTATEGEGNVTVTWEAPEGATQYNVFRKDATEAVVILTETPITEQEFLATDWNELSNGTYQYGVSAFVGGGSETFYSDDFSSDKGWTGSSNWSIGSGNLSITVGSSGFSRSYTSPTFTIGENAAIVKFDYVNTGANTLTVYLECDFSITLVTIPAGTEGTFISDPIDREHFGIDVLNTDAQIQFTCNSGGSSTTTVDNLVVYSESAPVETSINWATAIEKNDANVFTGTGEWTTAANWSNGVPAAGANVFIEGNVTIASNVNVNNMTINGGSVTINSGASLTVNGTLVNEDAANLVINDGAQIFQNNEDVPATFVMGITKPKEWQSGNKDGWQFISSPFTNASVFNFTNASEGNYDLFKYDGDEDLEWRNHKANAASFGPTFEQGVGYLASHETESTIELTGTLKAENYYSWNNLYYNEEKPLANFHLLGNPFTFNMDITKATFTNLVEGVAVVTSDGGYDYSQKTIPVGDAFFVKANGNDYNSSLSYGGRGARSEKSNSLNITATGNAGKDNVIINFAGKSEGFDKLQNFNDAIATVYVAEDGKNYGIYNCDADVQEVELSFNANKMGNYTISIEPNGKFQTVTLVDRFTGVETNMLVEDYNFTAMSSDNHNRFVVRFANGQQTTDNSHFVYQSGEELILNIQGEVQIVDVLGRVVYNGEAMNDINRINVSSFNSGAYMVKVMNGNDVKVEKIIL